MRDGLGFCTDDVNPCSGARAATRFGSVLFGLVLWFGMLCPTAMSQQVSAIEPFPYWGMPQGEDLITVDGGDIVALVPGQVDVSQMREGAAFPFRLERRGSDLDVIWTASVPIPFQVGVDGVFRPGSLRMTWMQLFEGEDAVFVFEAKDGKLLAHGFDMATGQALPVREVGPIETPQPGQKRFAFKSHYQPPPLPERVDVPFQMSDNGAWFTTAHAPDGGAVVFHVFDRTLKQHKRFVIESEDLSGASIRVENDGRLVVAQVRDGEVTLVSQPIRGKMRSASFKLRQPHVFDVVFASGADSQAVFSAVTGPGPKEANAIEVVWVDFKKRAVVSHAMHEDAAIEALLPEALREHYVPVGRNGLQLLPLLFDADGHAVIRTRLKYSLTTVTTTTESDGGSSTSSRTEYFGLRTLYLSVDTEGSPRFASMTPENVHTKVPFELGDLVHREGDTLRVVWRDVDFSWAKGAANAIRYADIDLGTGTVTPPRNALPEVRAAEHLMPQLSTFVSADEWVVVSRASVLGFGRKQAENTLISRVLPAADLRPSVEPASLKGLDKSHADWQIGEVVGRMAFRTDGFADFYRGAGVGVGSGLVSGFVAGSLWMADNDDVEAAGTLLFLGSLIGTPMVVKRVGAEPTNGWYTLQSPEFQGGYLKYQKDKRRARAKNGALLGVLFGLSVGTGLGVVAGG